jgi:hypothetical protein
MSLHQIYGIQCPHGGENISSGTEAVYLQNTANHLMDNPKSTYK